MTRMLLASCLAIAACALPPLDTTDADASTPDDDPSDPVNVDPRDTNADPGFGTPSAVEYCHLQWPCAQTAKEGDEVDLYTWVYAKGVTEAKGAGPGLVVELGWGADGSTPDETWTWQAASFNVDKGSNDEWTSRLAVPSAGAYDYAFRAYLPDAENPGYLMCDIGDDGEGGCGTGSVGSNDGYQPANAGQLTVK